MQEYPKMLFREGGEIEWEGRKLSILVVNDHAGEAEAVKAGWRTVSALLDPPAEQPKAKRAKVAA